MTAVSFAQQKRIQIVHADNSNIDEEKYPGATILLGNVYVEHEGVSLRSKKAIHYRENNIRDGRVIRLQGDLSREGRMARLLVSVPDPLGLSAGDHEFQPLVVGEYVRVEIVGEELQNVFKIPRTALRNDKEIWVATKEGRLSIRPVKILWREESHVLIRDGFQPEESLIVSDLPVPVDGMMIRIASKDEK